MDLLQRLKGLMPSQSNNTQQAAAVKLGSGSAESARQDLQVTPDYWQYVINESTAGRKPLNYQAYKTSNLQQMMQAEQMPNQAQPMQENPIQPANFRF